MTHDKNCPMYQFVYEIGSGEDIPDCNCKINYKAALIRIKNLCAKVYPNDNSKPTLEDFGRVLFMEEVAICSALQLAQEAEHMKERLKLFEIKGENDPRIVECCFFGQHRMTDKETIEHLYKWFKDFQGMLTYIEKQRNKHRDESEQLRKERDELATAIIKIREDQEGDYDFLKFISHPQYILAKKVIENE